ncbi:MAG: hypothetical protein ACRDVC_11625 [Acidimicrobiales bacterium]
MITTTPSRTCGARHRRAHRATSAKALDSIFLSPNVGVRGWSGVRLDQKIDWDELEMLLEDAYRCIATKRQLKIIDDSRP